MKRLLQMMFGRANPKPLDVKIYYSDGSLKAHFTKDGIQVWSSDGKLLCDTGFDA